ncbi:MAG: Gx transporter family protein [Coprococcus sp.]
MSISKNIKGKKRNGSKNRRYSGAKRIALLGMFTAVALVFSYIETFIPLNFAVPGIKLGLANIVTIVVLIQMGLPNAVLVSVARICLSALLFGNLSVMAYSLAGAAVSILIMKLIHMTGIFGITGVSICGGIGHNIGQLVLAAVLMENQSIMIYGPVLMITGTITGMLTGVVAAVISGSVKIS